MSDVAPGLRVQYEVGSLNSGVWAEEWAKGKLELKDTVEARTRVLTLEITNPQNSRAGQFYNFQRIRAIEPLSDSVVFFGRLDTANEGDWANTQGQVLRLVSRDYLSILSDQYFLENMIQNVPDIGPVQPYYRSDKVEYICQQLDVFGLVWAGSPYIQQSPQEVDTWEGPDGLTYVGSDYSQQTLTGVDIIESFAEVDPRFLGTNSPVGWDFYMDDGENAVGMPALHYFPRYDEEADMLFEHKGREYLDPTGTSYKKIFGDYKVNNYPAEHINRVHVRYYDQLSESIKTISYPVVVQGTMATYQAIRDIFIEDYTITDVSSAFLRAYAEIDKAESIPTRVSITCQGFPVHWYGGNRVPLRAGQTIRLKIDEEGVDGYFMVLEMTYGEPEGFTQLSLIDRGNGGYNARTGAYRSGPFDEGHWESNSWKILKLTRGRPF